MANKIRDNTRRVAFRCIQQLERAEKNGNHEVAQVLRYCLRGAAFNGAPSYAGYSYIPGINTRILLNSISQQED
jgi:hypothetical protein